MRWLYDQCDLAEVRADLAAWLAKWSTRYPRLTTWAEEAIEQTLTFFRLPRQHHKDPKSTNMLEDDDAAATLRHLTISSRHLAVFCSSFEQPRLAKAVHQMVVIFLMLVPSRTPPELIPILEPAARECRHVVLGNP